ncbi:Arginine--tRNA ligase [Candidatus Erwinia haradaeae]|uniref:Arginine--tRNA ligase n=1 Tax=Candidatus Erwinia haradaeae TaxID=1922217 RepID=A0A451DCR0_9GAMM|nr:arginine--tRNA ligase [Candidatus Erwinia haradaeae]VFP84227.1 Arginine--tRNA ligase [Candidatus Erwinia haradaeae]
MNIQNFLIQHISQAMVLAGAPVHYQAQVRKSEKSKFGDYQVNGVMALAKTLNIAPQKLAQRVLQNLNLHDIAKKVEIMSPGFLNIFLDSKWLSVQIDHALTTEKLGVSVIQQKTIVVDYSSPNVAKEMHVGHLRSTIIGDAIVRTLEFLGHNVIRANHIGDWGTHFGMLIAFLEKKNITDYQEISLTHLETLYREAKKNYDNDIEFAKRARSYVVKLQSGNKYYRKLWSQLVDITMKKNQLLYDRMNVTLKPTDTMGESLYQHMMEDIVSDLKYKNLAVSSHGATVVFLDEHRNQLGDHVGVIIQKKDGGYLYTTTDIACAKYRYEVLHADRIIYYIDSRQNKHLTQAWTIARKAGYIPKDLQLEHHMLGMVLGKDGKPFKTRTGDTIKLSHLLDEAVHRASQLIVEKNPHISHNELQKLAIIIGIGAVKYADLSKHRTTDYIFDWDNMLSFKGNTAPYMQYAYTRVVSIFRKSGIDPNRDIIGSTYLLNNISVELAISLLQFEETISKVACDGLPHIMCSYLYNVASIFSQFYESCQILEEKDQKKKTTYLKLALLTAKTLKCGLNTLGIDTVERM